ncbi:hypothetical protein ACL02R_29675 [Streptomyces sp. MS19]|uniref:hypothetical protein n=1 Tax=Streptomyces sp. MS19 TaxID=3385972 RepID=UPI0039A25F83
MDDESEVEQEIKTQPDVGTEEESETLSAIRRRVALVNAASEMGLRLKGIT